MTERQPIPSLSTADKPEKHLFRRVVHGGAWVFVLRILQQVLALARLLVLTYFLSPSSYAILVLALITTRITKIFTETGFHEALTQRQGDIREYLDDVWTVHVLRGIILFAIIVAGSPYLVTLLNNPTEPLDVDTTVLVLRVISISFLLSGFSNIGVVYFRKEMQFHKHFVRQISGILVDMIVSIVLLFLLRNVWALVLGKIAGEIILFVLSYVMHPFRPKFRLDRSRIRTLWSYGKWALGITVVGFLVTEGDDLFVAKLLGPTMLGLYVMAFRLGLLPTTEIAAVISQVTFPAYAKVQSNIPRLRDAYLKVLQFTAFLSFPLATTFIVLGREFIELFMTPKWHPMASALQLLATLGVFSSLVSCMSPLFRSLGRPKIVTYLISGKLIWMVVLIYPLAVYWDIAGVALATLLSTFLMLPFVYYQVVRHIQCCRRDMIRALLAPTGGMVTMAGSILGVKILYGMNIDIGAFFLCGVTGILSYLISVFGLDRMMGSEIKKMIIEQWNIFQTRNHVQKTE